MGEGWSDFYARLILATAGEDVNAVYAAGSYVTLNFLTLGTDNYYYGIRRFPYAVKTNLRRTDDEAAQSADAGRH